MRTDLRRGTLLYRDPAKDQHFVGFLKGDVWEFTDPPFHEVDPLTRKAKPDLQCFRVVNNDLKLQPVTRGSWLK